MRIAVRVGPRGGEAGVRARREARQAEAEARAEDREAEWRAREEALDAAVAADLMRLAAEGPWEGLAPGPPPDPRGPEVDLRVRREDGARYLALDVALRERVMDEMRIEVWKRLGD